MRDSERGILKLFHSGRASLSWMGRDGADGGGGGGIGAATLNGLAILIHISFSQLLLLRKNEDIEINHQNLEPRTIQYFTEHYNPFSSFKTWMTMMMVM